MSVTWPAKSCVSLIKDNIGISELTYIQLILPFKISYSGGDKTSVKTLTAYISHNKAKDPINLGAK